MSGESVGRLTPEAGFIAKSQADSWHRTTPEELVIYGYLDKRSVKPGENSHSTKPWPSSPARVPWQGGTALAVRCYASCSWIHRQYCISRYTINGLSTCCPNIIVPAYTIWCVVLWVRYSPLAIITGTSSIGFNYHGGPTHQALT